MKHQSLLSAQWKVHVHQERLLQLCFVDMACSLRLEPRNEANMATQHLKIFQGNSWLASSIHDYEVSPIPTVQCSSGNEEFLMNIARLELEKLHNLKI